MENELVNALREPALSDAMLMGQSPNFLAVKARLASIARVQKTTLLTGETGSGKDLIAQTLHDLSVRRGRPFVTIHCGALPENLIESELFGHSRGAFTGATQVRAGLVRSASQGTVFLDEIDSLPPSAQAKLLRFLETGEYRAVGSDRIEHSAAWVLAATNRDLHLGVARGQFRADLLYRLAVVRVDVPSLSQRLTDIPYLADFFLARASEGRKQFSEEARLAMRLHTWPGNVRELKHRVESAALLCEHAILDAGSLGLPCKGVSARPSAPPTTLATAEQPSLERELWPLIEQQGLTLSQAVALCERMMVQAALRAEGNNRTRAASRLGIHVRTIFKKLID